MSSQSNKPWRVLVTNGGAKHTLALITSLHEAGVACHVVEHRKLTITSVSRHVQERIVMPSSKEGGDAFARDIINLLRRGSYNQLIAVSAKDYESLAPHLGEINQYAKFICHDSEIINVAFSKVECLRAAESLGLPVAKYVIPASLLDVEAAKRELRFPVVLRKRKEGEKKSVVVVETPQELIGAMQTFSRNSDKPAPESFPIIQEQLRGDGYGFFGLYDCAQLKRFFMHRRIRELPVSGGPSTIAESVFDERLLGYGKKLLDHFRWHGVAMVEFKKGDDGEFYFIEVNPKFWGSLELAIVSGVNFPVDLCRIARDETFEDQEPYRLGVKFQWPFGCDQGDFSHGLRRPSNLGRVIGDFLSFGVYKNIRMRDPLPGLYLFIAFLLFELRALMRRVVQSFV